jgi:3-oxoacyl-[acyl-carrier protein] reductase
VSALVTGASGGIGRAVALALAADGHDVAVHYRSNADGAAGTVAGVEAAGCRAVALPADLAIADAADLDAACEDLLDRCTARLGAPGVVVLSAFPRDHHEWDSLATADWDAVHTAGLRPTTALLRRSTARMGAGGVVVAIGSIEALRAASTHAAYAVGKAAVHHLVAAAAHEVGPRGIRVTGVAPGLVDRDGLAEQWPEGLARWRAATSLRRPVTPREVAATVAFLASPAASGITGTTVVVDAGWSAAPGW